MVQDVDILIGPGGLPAPPVVADGSKVGKLFTDFCILLLLRALLFIHFGVTQEAEFFNKIDYLAFGKTRTRISSVFSSQFM